VLPRAELYDRQCVRDLVDLVEQLPWRAAPRGLATFDRETTGLLLLWTLLRSERTFAVKLLEELVDDVGALAGNVDRALESRRASSPHLPTADLLPTVAYDPSFRRHVNGWLDAAEMQAGGDYTGVEHLLFALLNEEGAAKQLLSQSGLEGARWREAVADAIRTVDGSARPVDAVVIEHHIPDPNAPPWAARWDRPAAGVPRRFGIGVLMLLVAMYAVLFSAMSVMGASPAVFVPIAAFITIVGLGQVLLFRSRYPRAASIYSGAVALPLVMLAVIVVAVTVEPGPFRHWGPFLALLFAVVFAAIPLGAMFGYLAGGLTAGVFLLIEQWKNRHPAADVEQPTDPFAEAP
jgi:hypothetical protein